MHTWHEVGNFARQKFRLTPLRLFNVFSIIEKLDLVAF